MVDLKLDKSCTSNPKSETSNWTEAELSHSPICDFGFGFEVLDSSNFTLSLPWCEKYVVSLIGEGSLFDGPISSVVHDQLPNLVAQFLPIVNEIARPLVRQGLSPLFLQDQHHRVSI